MIEPTALLLDVTRRCNADCRICGRRFWPKGTKLPDLDFALALRLIDLPSIDRVCFGQYGEPLLWEPLPRAIRHASQRGLFTWLTTNGQLLNEARATALLEAGLGKIILSIDALDPVTYAGLRPGLDFRTVIRHLETLLHVRAERASYRTQVVVNLVRSPENEASSDADVRAYFLAKGVDGVAITPEIDVSPQPTTTSDGEPITCERPYDHLTVRADGTLMLCCRDCHGTAGDLGEALPEPIATYNAPPLTTIRTALETGRGVPAICRGCRAHWPDHRSPIRAPEA